MTRVYLYKRLEVNRYHGCLDVLQLDRESWFFFQKKFFSSKSHLERKKEKKVPSNPENLDLVLGLIPWSTGPRQDRTEHSSARPHKLLHQAAQIPAHPSFTHPSRFRASEASGDRRQPAAPPPPPCPRQRGKVRLRFQSGEDCAAWLAIADSLPPVPSPDLLRRGKRCGALPVVFPASNLTRSDDVRYAFCLVDSVCRFSLSRNHSSLSRCGRWTVVLLPWI